MRQWTLRGGGGPESCHAPVDVKRGKGAQTVAMRQSTLRGGRGPRELPCAGGR